MIDQTDIIFGAVQRGSEIKNIITTLIKFYIYTQRVKGIRPTFVGAKRAVEYYNKLEKHSHMMNIKFQSRWNILTKLFDDK